LRLKNADVADAPMTRRGRVARLAASPAKMPCARLGHPSCSQFQVLKGWRVGAEGTSWAEAWRWQEGLPESWCLRPGTRRFSRSTAT
jgi:hypothetical protein